MMFRTGFLSRCALLAIALAIGADERVFAQEVESNAGGVIPTSYQGAGSFFNQQLGTVLRASYQSKGYGPQDDIVTLGSMKVFNLNRATLFLDGQATLSEEFGGGFNAGIGYRQLVDTCLRFDSQRIHGISLWADGQSTSADNFYNQLGYNLESLGELFDLRFGGYFPLERTKYGEAKLVALDAPMFVGNHLLGESVVRSIDTSHSVVDAEIAKRIGNLEAWAFGGAYQIGRGGIDTTGYRGGVRGYATPDLALSLQVTDDDVYHTNVMFGLTWFVGRTHRGNHPRGTILDRFREPVQRNNFVVTTQTEETLVAGDPLTDAITSADLRFVHVDSSAAAGGDGTFENPLDTFANVFATSQDDDTILVHAGSTVSNISYTFKDGQRVIGEGGNIIHTANTAEVGVLNLPETSSGAIAGTVPIVNGVGDVFTMANNNELNNFTINNGTRAVVASAVNAPEMRNLSINGITGDGIVLTSVTGTSVIENTVSINNAGGVALLVDGGSDTANLAPMITNAADRSVIVRNRTGGTTTIGGTITDTGTGILVENNTGGTIDFTGAITLNTGTNDAVQLMTNAGAAVNFTGGLDINTTSGIGFFADTGGTIAATGTNTIVTTTGVGLDVSNMTIGAADLAFDSVNVSNGTTGIDLDTLGGTGQVIVGSGVNPGDGGTLVASGTAIRINDVNEATFSNVTVNNVAANSDGVIVTNSAGDMVFFSGLDVTTDRTGLSVTGGGEVAATGTNTISTMIGQGLEIKDQTINVAGVTFNSVSVAAGTTTGIELENLTGGTVTIGPNTNVAGAGGTLATQNQAILVTDVESAVFNDVTVSSAGSHAVEVESMSAASSDVTFDNLTVTAANNAGVAVMASGTGEFDVTLQDSSISGVGSEGILFETVAGSNRVDLTLTDNTITATNDHAFEGNLAGTGDVRFLFTGNTMSNNSAASATLDVSVTTALTLNATIGSQNIGAPLGDSNSFTNADGGGTAFAMDLNDAGATLNLDLRDNTAAGGAVNFVLTETIGTFGIVDLSNTVTADTNNVGSVDGVVGDFDDLVAPIDQVTP